MASPFRNQDSLPTRNNWKSMNSVRLAEKPQKSARQIDIEGISALEALNPEFEVRFFPGDPENPRNWSPLFRTLVVGSLAYTAWATTLFSTCFDSGIPGMMEDFGIHNETVLQLGLSLYLVGMGIGSLILAPLSETFGRRPMYIVSLIAFLVLVPLCGTAKTFTPVLIYRFLASLVGVVVLAVAPGSIVDAVEPRQLQLAIAVYIIGPMNGPTTGPIIVGLGGFTFQRWGWRSLNWLVLIMVGVGALCIFLIPETYEPVILRKRAALRRRETGNSAWWSRYDNKIALPQVIKVAIGRPFKLAFTEPVLWFWNMYISITYAVLYLSFVAYPIIYSGNRHWSAGLTGLSFLGVFIGTSLATVCEPLCRKIIAAQPKDPRTGQPYPEASLCVVCMAAILAPVGQLVFALTSLPISIHWAGGLIAGIPFGLGNTVIFIFGTSYISMAYGRYASSAMAGNAVCRFGLGAILVLVGSNMYRSLTPRIAGLVLAGIEFAIIPIPFVFYFWGAKIRMRSKVVQEMMAELETDSRDAMDSRYGPDPGHDIDIEPNLGAGSVKDSGCNTNSESIEMGQIIGAGTHKEK